MKKFILVVAIVMLVVAMAGSTWAATTTQTVTTTATVQGLCKNGTNGTLSFPSIDPSGGANVIASTAGLTYSCSNGTTFTITGIDGGTGGIGGVSAGNCAGFTGIMKDVNGTGLNTMNYTLTCAGLGAGPYTGQGFGAGKAVGIVLDGTITPPQFQNAFAGAYSDVVTVTVTY